MKKISYLILPALALALSVQVSAKENIDINGGKKAAKPVTPLKAVAEACNPASSRTDLSINNVRTTILGGGDMWWDLVGNGQYEIPKGSNRHSLFAGALWFGGIDDGGQLKVAAMTYRQTGNDFWPGPLDQNAATDKAICDTYDKHYRVTLEEVKEHKAWLDDPTSIPGYNTPTNILNWAEAAEIGGPFVDLSGTNTFDPEKDYPGYDLDNAIDCGSIDEEDEGVLFGDETLFWVINDKGNIHSESGAESIGLEIHAQAFGFATNDEVNNMTFYSYKIINRATTTLNEVYMGQWVDPDLGNAVDDWVGCDVARGLGYVFNGTDVDGGAQGYGEHPPALGIDFFQGPLADENDGIDNDRDCVIDEPGEQIVMSKFVYYNNDFSLQGNPSTGTHFYNYLDGKWKDGLPMVYGGDGRTSGGPACDFMFPGDSDQEYGWGVGGDCNNPVATELWTEKIAGNPPADRRFLQSAGKFTLTPGAVNFVTTGAVWARTRDGNAFASVEEVRLADDLAQALFDNCFRVSDGPDAPTVNVIEDDRRLILTLDNLKNSNNYLEQFKEKDPLIICPGCDTNFVFEGYQVYQVVDATVTSFELNDPQRARLIAQFDVKNGVTQLVNYDEDKAIGALVPREMVNGADEGISHSILVTDDQFATGDRTLVNHKDYYFMAVAYAYNNYKEYDPSDPEKLDGQKKPYKAGRNNIKTYKGVPHKLNPESGGTELNAAYGEFVEITRLDGEGNGGNAMYLTDESRDEIASSFCMANPVYSTKGGPIKVKIIDPTKVKAMDFTVELDGVGENAKFLIRNAETGDSILPAPTVGIGTTYEYLYPDYGFSVEINEVPDVGDESIKKTTNGFIAASGPTESWLSFLEDSDVTGSPLDWIVGSGAKEGSFDTSGVYANVLGGTWAPYPTVAYQPLTEATSGHAPGLFGASVGKISNTNSIDVVFTADKSLWTRVPVVELQDETVNAEGGVKKGYLRAGASVDKDGNPDGTGNGWSWFPGYAIDVDRGIRLNVMFGEDSWLVGDNGRDMMFNPTAKLAEGVGNIVFGGKHYIYIMGSQYQGDDQQNNPHFGLLDKPSPGNLRRLCGEIAWVSIPLANPNLEFLSSDLTYSIRVNQPYVKTGVCGLPNGNPKWGFSTQNLAAERGNLEIAKSALDLIHVVPNPYTGYSEYENGQLDNTVKIINVPQTCTVSIYTVSGLLVKRFVKDSPETSLVWDLKNNSGIPVASGVYMFHINAGEAGEKVVKWFGARRPVDLDTF